MSKTTKTLQIYGAALTDEGFGCQDYTNAFQLTDATLVADSYLAELEAALRQRDELLKALNHYRSIERPRIELQRDQLLAAMTTARDWFESQARSISKGSGSSWDLMTVREQRDACDAAIVSVED